MALKLEQTMEGEWRLGCPVNHHKQGVHSNSKDLNRAPKEVHIQKDNRCSKELLKEGTLRQENKISIFYGCTQRKT